MPINTWWLSSNTTQIYEPKPNVGLPELIHLSIQKMFAFPKYLLGSLNHIHIWQVSQQLSCCDTCQIWMWYLTAKQSSNWLSAPHPETRALTLAPPADFRELFLSPGITWVNLSSFLDFFFFFCFFLRLSSSSESSSSSSMSSSSSSSSGSSSEMLSTDPAKSSSLAYTNFYIFIN